MVDRIAALSPFCTLTHSLGPLSHRLLAHSLFLSPSLTLLTVRCSLQPSQHSRAIHMTTRRPDCRHYHFLPLFSFHLRVLFTRPSLAEKRGEEKREMRLPFPLTLSCEPLPLALVLVQSRFRRKKGRDWQRWAAGCLVRLLRSNDGNPSATSLQAHTGTGRR